MTSCASRTVVIRESPPGFAADADQALASARRVAALGFERFIGYHGGYAVSGAGELLSASLSDQAPDAGTQSSAPGATTEDVKA